MSLMGDKSGFGGRLRGVMFAAGFESPSQLAKVCGASRQTIKAWLAMPEARVLGTRLLTLADCLRVRVRWLITGQGIAGWQLYASEPELERAVSVLEALTTRQRREWLGIGERMAGEG